MEFESRGIIEQCEAHVIRSVAVSNTYDKVLNTEIIHTFGGQIHELKELPDGRFQHRIAK